MPLQVGGVGSGSGTTVQQAPPSEDQKVQSKDTQKTDNASGASNSNETKSTASSTSTKQPEDAKSAARTAQGSKQNATDIKSQQNMQAQVTQKNLQKKLPAAKNGTAATANTTSGGHSTVNVSSPMTMFGSDLKNNRNFKRLDPTVKNQILKQMQQNPHDTAGLEQLQRIATDSNFGKISKDVQKQVLNTMDQIPIETDPDKTDKEKISVDKARDQLRQLATDDNFAKLTPNAQKIALHDLSKAPDKDVNLISVKEGVKAGVLLESNQTFNRLDPGSKKQVLELVGQNGLSPSAREQLIKLATSPDLKNPTAVSAYLGGLTYDQLKELTVTTGEGKIFKSIEEQLKQTSPPQLTQLMNAKNVAVAETHENFGNLSPDGKNRVRIAFEKNQFNEHNTEKLLDLVYLTKLDQLPDSKQKKILDAVANPNPAISNTVHKVALSELGESTKDAMIDAVIAKSGDASLLKSLNDLASYSSPLSRVSKTEGHKVVGDMLKFTETQSYKKMSPADREQGMEFIASLSIHSANNPTLQVARNTLDRLVKGDVPIEIYRDEKNQDTLGQADKGGIKINASNLGNAIGGTTLVSTVAHEVNHVLNGENKPGTPSRFLDEYRAYWVGTAAIGEKPNANDLKETLRLIATDGPDGGGYDHLRKLYKDSRQFRNVVNEMVTDLNSNPPKITTPEQLRLKLRDLRKENLPANVVMSQIRSAPTMPNTGAFEPYLNKPGNIDNSL